MHVYIIITIFTHLRMVHITGRPHKTELHIICVYSNLSTWGQEVSGRATEQVTLMDGLL
jgi:hypothetical protein